MTGERLAVLADISAIYMLVNFILFAIFMAVIGGFTWWHLRRLRRKMGTPLLQAQVFALRVQHHTQKVSEKIVRVPIELNAGVDQISTTSKALVRRRNK